MLNTTPHVYYTNPGSTGNTGTAGEYIKALNTVITSANPHHWEVVPGSYSYTSTSVAQIQLRCLANTNRVLSFFSTSTATVQGNISLDGGTTWQRTTAAWNIASSTAAYYMTALQYGSSKSRMVVVEYEDAIIWGSWKQSTDAYPSGLVADGINCCFHAGRIVIPHNKNDQGLDITGEGILGGNAQCYDPSNTFGWLGGAVTSGYGSGIWANGFQYINYINNLASTTGGNVLLSNTNDGSTRRFVPYTIEGGTCGIIGATKYIRAGLYGYASSDPTYGTIGNLTFIPTSNPNLYFKHNLSFNGGGPFNMYIAWCAPGNEVSV